MRLKNKYLIIILFVLSFIPVISLLHSGLPITHDGQDHVARIANFYLNLSQGNLVPVWAPNLNWGYGHPILEFLYPLPSYIASIFHFLTFSFVDSAKLVFILGMVLSTLFMYLWLSQFMSKYSSLLGAVLYTYAPYRFVEVYVRGDIGENLAFAFIPLVLFFVHKSYKTKDMKYAVWGAFSLAFLILAHNAIALMFVPFIFLYAAYLIWISKFDRNLILNSIFLILFGFVLSAFFWIPGLIEGKYTLRDIVTRGGYLDRFVSFSSLLYGPWNYGQTGQFTVQFGIVQWLGLILSPLAFFHFKKNKEKQYLLILSLLFTVLAVFLMLPVSNIIWSKIMLLQNFQFPWRFLAIVVFATSVIGALVFESFERRINAKVILVLIVSAILAISSFYWSPKGYLQKPESFYTGIYNGTTDTGESSPIWSVRFMLKQPVAPIQIIEGRGRAKELVNKATFRQFQLTSEGNDRILINILYFPNWTVYVDGRQTPVQFQDPQYRGLMTFTVGQGNHQIQAVFKATKLREISEIFSVFSLILLLGFVVFRFVKK